MPIIQPENFARPELPELVLGIVAAVGTPLSHILGTIEGNLSSRGYSVTPLRLSRFLDHFELSTPPPSASAPEHERLHVLMSRGNELRHSLGGGDALALFAAAEVNRYRPEGEPEFLNGRAFLLRQLKHPDEVTALRLIYGAAFQLIAVYCPEAVRLAYLHNLKKIPKDEAQKLVERDRGEDFDFGQQLTKTFHRADAFISLDGLEDDSFGRADDQLARYFSLLFGEHPLSPNKDEYGMYLAYAAGLRSADLSRQVGAAIQDPSGEIISLGANEVPAPGGGQYWSTDPDDARDLVRRRDANAEITFEALNEIFAELNLPGEVQSLAKKLRTARLMNLTEFGRAVHAEMEALLAAGRKGLSARGTTLFTTTFPCHNCAKHIIDAGILRVVYIEPYPKSLVDRLHSDAVSLPEVADSASDPNPPRPRVRFVPFTGISPTLYPLVFSTLSPEGLRLKQKDAKGYLLDKPFGLRIFERPLNYIDRERAASLVLDERMRISSTESTERPEGETECPSQE